MPSPPHLNTSPSDLYPDIPNTHTPPDSPDSPVTLRHHCTETDAKCCGLPARSSPRRENSENCYNFDDIIPQFHPYRTLVLCFDGTGDQFDNDNSNIVQFFSMLMKDNSKEQLVYYQAGIGTYTIPQIAKPVMAKISKRIDSMIGVHLDAHVMAGYEFLMQNYECGDRINVFGFSRGAYTARALAGMVHKVGLLPKCNHQQVPFAYKMYCREDKTGWRQSSKFKKAFSIDVDIHFVGVWDTVGSVGVITNKRLPFTKTNTNIRYFRHAISLDEHRARFHPNIYNRSSKEDCKKGVQAGEMPKSRGRRWLVRYGLGDKEEEEQSGRKREKTLVDLEREFSEDWHQKETDVEEVWFAGCHCDVGGGSVTNGTRYSLARIPLRWMIRQCFLLKTGIRFHSEMLRTIGLDPATLFPTVLPRPPPLTTLPTQLLKASPNATIHSIANSTILVDEFMPPCDFINEETEDLLDAMTPIFDQLKISKSWWLLEVIPMRKKIQKDDDTWSWVYSVNLGRGRAVPRQGLVGVKVHRTVKIRQNAEGLKQGPYKPKAKLKVEPTWVD